MSEARAVTNFAGNSVATVLVGHWTGTLDHAQLDRVLSGERPFDETTMVDDHDSDAYDAYDDEPVPATAVGDLPAPRQTRGHAGPAHAESRVRVSARRARVRRRRSGRSPASGSAMAAQLKASMARRAAGAGRRSAARSGSLTASVSAAARSATYCSGSSGVPVPSVACSIGTSQPVSPSDDDLGDAAGGGGDDRGLAGHRLEVDDAERLVDRRAGEDGRRA